MPRRTLAIDRRLQELTLSTQDAPPPPRLQRMVNVMKRIGEKVPRSPKEMGTLRLRLVQAGFRREEAVTIFFGIRVLFAVILFLFLSSNFLARANTMMALGGLGLGYILPGMVLARLAKAPFAPDPVVTRRRPRPARRQRRGGPRPRPGALAGRIRAGVCLSGALGRTEVDQPRAARRQGARRSAAQPGGPHRRR